MSSAIPNRRLLSLLALFCLFLPLLAGCRQDDPPPVTQIYPLLVFHVDGDAVDALDYGEVNVGYYRERSFDVVNAGIAPLKISSLGLENGGVFDNRQNYFELINPPTLPLDLPSGASLTVRIKFYAFNEGNVTDQILLKSNDVNRPDAQFPLTAEGVTPIVEVDPASITFSGVDVGQSERENFTLANEGRGELLLLDLYFEDEGLGFDYQLPSGFQVGSGVTNGFPVEIGVTFTPDEASSVDTTLVLVTNDPVTPRVEIPVVGNGTVDTPPEVKITLPLAGSTLYTGESFVISAEIKDDRDALSKLRILIDSLQEGTLCDDGFTADETSGVITCTDNLQITGAQTVRVTAIDSANHSTTATVNIEVWNEEEPLDYVISGSDQSSFYAFTPDDNLQILLEDVDGNQKAVCVNDMGNEELNSVSPKTCNGKYGDVLHLKHFDRYGGGFKVPQLYLWYGAHDEWNQPIVAEEFGASRANYDELVSYNPACEPAPTRAEWEAENGTETYPEDCLVYEVWIPIQIPPIPASTLMP